MFFISAFFAWGINRSASPIGEKQDSALTPNAPGGPKPRNEKEPDPNPVRGLPSGAEVYNVMKIETDPKTGEQHLVPVEDSKK